MTHNPHDAEDLVQETCTRLHRARGQLRAMLRKQAAERGIVRSPRYSAGS